MILILAVELGILLTSIAANGWISVTTGVYITADPVNNALLIKTDSTLGSHDRIVVYFANQDGQDAGAIQIKFSTTLEYMISFCTPVTVFPSTPPGETDKVWRITIDDSANIRVKVYCNGEEVLSTPVSDDVCTEYSSWRHQWDKNKEKILFRQSWDNASDYYTFEGPCSSGQYLDHQSSCQDCPADEWSTVTEGNVAASCTDCPSGKGVAAGQGTSEGDCVWKPCSPGHFLDQQNGCQGCPANQWSSGGNATSCNSCPDGKGVLAGQGTSEVDCVWEPCSPGHYLDRQNGCQGCPANQWSSGGNATSCNNCPDGKVVEAGQGTSASLCMWEVRKVSSIKEKAPAVIVDDAEQEPATDVGA